MSQPQTDNIPAGGNTKKLVSDLINEMVTLEDEIEKVMEPLKERRKDLMSTAKDNKLNTGALKRAVKYKRADNRAKKAMSQELTDTDTYLSFFQLTLFPEAAA